MGLDMYLTKKIYIGGNYDHNQVEGIVDIKQIGKQIPIDLSKVTYIEEQVAYWRKANAIHKWFVDNVQEGNDNCQSYYVSKDKIKELLDLCKKVKDTAIITEGDIKAGATFNFNQGKFVQEYTKGKIIQNAEEIAKILPTQDGFFFGCTDYDEYYLEDIEYTIKTFEELLKDIDDFKKKNIYFDLEYSSSW